MTLKIGALTKLGLFFPVTCFIYVFDQTLAEQLCRDKGLFSIKVKSVRLCAAGVCHEIQKIHEITYTSSVRQTTKRLVFKR